MQNNAYMVVLNNSAYDFGIGNFTFEAWIKPSSPGTIISRKGTAGGAGNGGFLLVLKPDGQLKLATDNGFGFFEIDSEATNVFDSDWHHVAGVRNGAKLYLYLDGELLPTTNRGNATPPLNVNNNLRLLIGATDQSQEPNNHYEGLIDEVRVWTIARSQGDLNLNRYSILSSNEQGLVGYWQLNGNGNDSSSVKNNARPQGSVSYVTPGSPLAGANDSAVSLQNSYMAAPNYNVYDWGTGNFTLETWFQTTSTGTLISRKGTSGGSGSGGFLLVLKPNGVFKLATDNGFGFFEVNSEATSAANGQWNHIAAVREGANLKLYMNGQLLSSAPGGNATPPLNVNNNLRLLMGATDQSQEPYNRYTGYLNQVRVWNTARPQNQIIQYMYQTVSGDEPGLVGYWTYADQSGNDSSFTHNNASPVGNVTYISPGSPILPCTTMVCEVLLSAGWRSAEELTHMSPEDMRNTLIVELNKHSTDSIQSLQGQSNVELAWHGLMYLWLVEAKIRTPQQLSDMSLDNQRNTTIVENHNHTGKDISKLQALNNWQLTEMAYGWWLPEHLKPLIEYSGTTLTAEWTAVTQAGVTGYTINYTIGLFEGDNLVTSKYSNTTSTSLDIDLEPTQNYEVKVRANSSSSSGPWSTSVWVIVGVPTFSEVAYNGSAVRADWSAVNESAVTGYTLSIFDGETIVGSQAVSGISGEVTVELDPNQTYTVKVQATGDKTTGPLSTGVGVIVEAATISVVSYDGSQVSASWSAVNESAVTGYTLSIFDGETVVASNDVTENSGSVMVNLDQNKNYLAKVQGTAEKTKGPWSAGVGIIQQVPNGLELYYNHTALVAVWNAVTNPNITGYTAQLDKNSSVAERKETTQTTVTFEETLEYGATYQAQVRAIGDKMTGPWSSLVSGPYSTQTTYTYDPLGRLKTMTDSQTTLTYTYDDRGNILTQTHADS